MEIRELKALVELMDRHGLTELEIEDRKGKVRLVRGVALSHAQSEAVPTATNNVVRPAPAAGRKQEKASTPPEQPARGPLELAPNQKMVRSPMVGTFYRSSSPESPPFAEEGATVKKGQVLCIIEAMKMMNEIEAEVAGKIVSVLAENGQPVEYEQPLFVIEIG